MVWQRRETSVLFSLTICSQRNDPAAALVQPETLIPVAGASPAVAGASGRPDWLYFADASEIRHVAEALARKRNSAERLYWLSSV